MPAYRAEGFIARAAQSLLRQTRDDWELVIGSDDGVDYAALLLSRGLEALRGRVRCASTGGTAMGPSRARNAALDAAGAPYLVTLDADDLLDPTALEVLVAMLQTYGAAYTARRVIDHETLDELESFDRVLPTGPVTLDDVLTSLVHSHAGIAFDRRRVRARWPSTRELWEDVNFFARCFDSIEHMGHSAEPLYVYARRNGSICNRPETGREYLAAGRALLARIETGDRVEIESDEARASFARFLRARVAIEEAYLTAQRAGACADYRDFVAQNPARFYTLL